MLSFTHPQWVWNTGQCRSRSRLYWKEKSQATNVYDFTQWSLSRAQTTGIEISTRTCQCTRGTRVHVYSTFVGGTLWMRCHCKLLCDSNTWFVRWIFVEFFSDLIELELCYYWAIHPKENSILTRESSLCMPYKLCVWAASFHIYPN